ncbi:MAG: zf-TFIIB domain-containing protein [Candidatus Binatus sp.]|uniref:zf-TFIIB domain-containing protein n=1 Tax=Candidatus Binatus sp. TaxID=2811406 RepID=UPI003C7081E6
MTGDNKDRLGGKLRDVEAAREDQWARQRDADLLERMRERMSHTACPHCKQFLEAKTEAGVPMHVCPAGHGAWLDAAALKALQKEHK